MPGASQATFVVPVLSGAPPRAPLCVSSIVVIVYTHMSIVSVWLLFAAAILSGCQWQPHPVIVLSHAVPVRFRDLSYAGSLRDLDGALSFPGEVWSCLSLPTRKHCQRSHLGPGFSRGKLGLADSVTYRIQIESGFLFLLVSNSGNGVVKKKKCFHFTHIP